MDRTIENKKIVYFLLAIALVLVFTFTLADHINNLGYAKAPWLHRSDKDIVYELRLDIRQLEFALSAMNQSNRYLRKLVYSTKPDDWTTWIALLDHCKELEEKIEELQDEIRILEKKLDIRLWQMPAPYQKV